MAAYTVRNGYSTVSSSFSAASDDETEVFKKINDHEVQDITLEFFYKPHTITLLSFSLIALAAHAFFYTRSDVDVWSNVSTGVIALALFFIFVISLLAFPNGPFTRPHPALWKMAFGASISYLLFLIFILYQDRATVDTILYWMDPGLKNVPKDARGFLLLGQYGENCSDISVSRLRGMLDIYVFAHFFGWGMKALLIRHYGICWIMSVTWEITELAFVHLLPNFEECWWDQLILDVLISNGLGIWLGMYVCKKLEMRVYHWEGIKEIQTRSGKLIRAMLQFTPESWMYVRWMDPQSSNMRIFAVYQLVLLWQISELNTFFLKHIFVLPPSHWFVWGRILFVGVISAPTMRQYYRYMTDTRCKRLGTQCWMFLAVTLVELMVCVKFGSVMFVDTELVYLAIWLITLMLISMLGVYLMTQFIYFQKYFHSIFGQKAENHTKSSGPKRRVKISHSKTK